MAAAYGEAHPAAAWMGDTITAEGDPVPDVACSATQTISVSAWAWPNFA
jgi:hypothetical protein